MLGTHVVTQEKRTVIHNVIDGSQEGSSTIGKLDVIGRTQHEQVLEFLLERKGSFSDKTVRELLLDAKARDQDEISRKCRDAAKALN